MRKFTARLLAAIMFVAALAGALTGCAEGKALEVNLVLPDSMPEGIELVELCYDGTRTEENGKVTYEGNTKLWLRLWVLPTHMPASVSIKIEGNGWSDIKEDCSVELAEPLTLNLPGTDKECYIYDTEKLDVSGKSGAATLTADFTTTEAP